MRCVTRILLLAIAVCALGITALSAADEPKPAAAAPKGEPIRIGAVFSVTGGASWLGEPEQNMVRMIEAEVNAQGGINGRPIEVIVKDVQTDETLTINAVKELLRSNVVAIIGPSLSGPSMAVAPVCEEAQVPLVSCAALEKIVEGKKWVFKIAPKDTHVVERIYDHMKAKGTKKIAILSSTDGFGAGGRDTLKAKAKDYGIEIVADETYGAKDTDLTAQLTKVNAAGPEAIVNWSIVPAQSLLMKKMKELGIKTQLYQSHGFANLRFLQAAGDAAEGVLFPASRPLVVEDLPADHPQKAILVKLKKDYEAKYPGDTLSTFAGHGYDSLTLVLNACKAKSATPKDIRDYIESCQGFVGTAGTFNFSPEDHTGLTKDALEMLTVKDGKFVIAPK